MFKEELLILMANLKEVINVETSSAQLFNVFKSYDKNFSKKEFYRVLEDQEYIINDDIYFKFKIQEVLENDNYILVLRNYRIIVR